MNYTYQELSNSGNWSNPWGADVEHASSMPQLRRALERWGDTNDDYNQRNDASIMVWKGTLDDVTDVYPDFELRFGPRGGVIRIRLE